MRELNEILRKVFYLHAGDSCARDLNVVRARHRSTTWPPPGTVQELDEKTAKETHKTYQCRCWTREGEKCTDFFETHKARVAHEVHALWLGGTRGLHLDVTTMTATHESPMCANSRGASFSKWKVFRESICSGLRMGGKGGDRTTCRMP